MRPDWQQQEGAMSFQVRVATLWVIVTLCGCGVPGTVGTAHRSEGATLGAGGPSAGRAGAQAAQGGFGSISFQAVGSLEMDIVAILESAPANCTTTVASPCVHNVCINPFATRPGLAVDAGLLTLTGTPDSFVVEFSPRFGYEPVSAEFTPTWQAGQTLTLTASGGELPPMQVSLVGPEFLTFTSPLPPDHFAAPIPVTRGQDLPLTWQPLANGNLHMTLSSFVRADNTTEILECTFPGAVGSATVPGEATALLLPGRGDHELRFNAQNRTVINTPGWNDVTFSLTAYGFVAHEGISVFNAEVM
jgi:hypothetical protein